MNSLSEPLAGGYDEEFSIKDATMEVRRGFVRKVYGILCAQLLLTVVVAGCICRMDKTVLIANQWMMGVSLVVTFGTLIAMACCRDFARKFPANYLLLFAFTAAEGVAIGFLSAQYTSASILWAVGLTGIIFLWMTAYAFTTKTDFTGYGPYLFAALSGMCTIGLGIFVMQMFGMEVKGLQMVYQSFGILLFTFYIVFDTQLMLGAFGGHQVSFSIDDYVFAALNLYLDIINLFMYILQLFGDRDSN
mmetsp:Transcript_40029/g.72573  ORF Transcript_40029/g.72573 Transcript_40029/m.72573 type:complete len:247 (+) Transcript_40029:89-829(+)